MSPSSPGGSFSRFERLLPGLYCLGKQVVVSMRRTGMYSYGSTSLLQHAPSAEKEPQDGVFGNLF